MTLSKERIEQFISDPLEYGLTRSEQMEMARRLLAVEVQEPVAWTCQGALEDVQCGSTAMMGPEGQVGFEPLYAAPQPAPVAQSVQVPDAIEPTYEATKAILPTTNPDEYACCVGADMWNACRAAMLKVNTQED